MAARWPWNRVRGFAVKSLANGNMLVEPDWIKSCEWPDEPGVGGPGLFSRLRMALWIEGRLKKRGQQPLQGTGKQP